MSKKATGGTAAGSSTSVPTFIQNLRRLANSAPDGDEVGALIFTKEIHSLYKDVVSLKLPDPRKNSTTGTTTARYSEDPAPQMVATDVMYNIVVTSDRIYDLEDFCDAKEVPLLDEEWAFTYGIPMAYLCKFHTDRMGELAFIADQAMKALLGMYLKLDMASVSSECKVEVLRVLGVVLEGHSSVVISAQAVHLVLVALFEDRAGGAELRKTRQETAKIVMDSSIVGPFLKFLVSKSSEKENGQRKQLRTTVKLDVCCLLGVVFTTLFGEIDPEFTTKHAPDVQAAMSSIGDGLWDELTRLGYGQIFYLKKVPHGTAGAEGIVRLAGVTRCFQTLAMFCDGLFDTTHIQAAGFMAYMISACTCRNQSIEPNEEHRDDAALVSLYLCDRYLPLPKDVRDWLAEEAPRVASSMSDIFKKSMKRAAILAVDGGVEYLSADSTTALPEGLSREEAENLLVSVLDPQEKAALMSRKGEGSP
jgi:hypothetical protein